MRIVYVNVYADTLILCMAHDIMSVCEHVHVFASTYIRTVYACNIRMIMCKHVHIYVHANVEVSTCFWNQI